MPKYWRDGVSRYVYLLEKEYDERPKHLDLLYRKLDRKYLSLWKKNRTISRSDVELIQRYLGKETWEVEWHYNEYGECTELGVNKGLYDRSRGTHFHPVAVRQIQVSLRMMHSCLRDNRAKKEKFVKTVAENPERPISYSYQTVC